MPDSYPDVRAALLRRGWVENNDASSGCFNLKWCLRTRAIDKPPLAKCQMVNHFRKTSCLTTKNGLAQYVLGSIWRCSDDALIRISYHVSAAGLYSCQDGTVILIHIVITHAALNCVMIWTWQLSPLNSSGQQQRLS